MPLGPLLRTLCFSGWALVDEPARSEPFAPRERGDGVSFGCPVVTSVVTPLGHPRVGRVPCAVLWPGLCPHPMSSLPSCSGLHPSTELPPPAAVPPPPCPMAFHGQWRCFSAHAAGVPMVASRRHRPRWGWQWGVGGRALPQRGGGCCLNTIRFVESGPAFLLISRSTSSATSCRHNAGATHGPGHGAPPGVGTPWRSLYIASKRNKTMKCENNDRFK